MTRWLSVFYFNSPFFKPWQIITYMFMHANVAHILFNMLGLFMIGPILEYSLGSKKFFNFYFICGIGAIVLQWIVQAVQVYHLTGGITIPDPQLQQSYDIFGANAQKLMEIYSSTTLGASGAVFGVMVGFATIYPNMELALLFLPIPIKAKYFVSIYIAGELYMSVFQVPGDHVAHMAHIGGALFGFLLIKIWGIKGSNNFL
jgi:rhomboid-like protein